MLHHCLEQFFTLLHDDEVVIPRVVEPLSFGQDGCVGFFGGQCLPWGVGGCFLGGGSFWLWVSAACSVAAGLLTLELGVGAGSESVWSRPPHPG